MIPGGRRFLLACSREDADHVREELRSLPDAVRDPEPKPIRTVCGLDAAYAGEYSAGAAVVMTFPGLLEICRATAVQKTKFPYIPGYLAFREGPVLFDAFQGLGYLPDLLLFNGHGRAHPEKFGLATHLGVVLGIPSIGVAKRRLAGFSYDASDIRGGITSLTLGDETVGSVIRRRKGGGLLFISPGYGVDIVSATSLVMKTFGTHALPEPLWHADRASRECLAEYLGSHGLTE